MISLYVGGFSKQMQGARERSVLDEALEFENAGDKNDLTLTKNITAEVELLKLPHEINVQLHDLKSAMMSVCTRCLAPFDFQIHIPFTEREFIIDLTDRELAPDEEVFHVDLMKNVVVLDEMIRQEILLHIPYNPVCSDGCQGLCDQCGANLNTAPCGCEKRSKASDSPFHILTT